MGICFFRGKKDGLRLFGANHEVDIVLRAEAVSYGGEEGVLLNALAQASCLIGRRGLDSERE